MHLEAKNVIFGIIGKNRILLPKRNATYLTKLIFHIGMHRCWGKHDKFGWADVEARLTTCNIIMQTLMVCCCQMYMFLYG